MKMKIEMKMKMKRSMYKMYLISAAERYENANVDFLTIKKNQ